MSTTTVPTTADELKDRTGGRTLEIVLVRRDQLTDAKDLLCRLAPPEGVGTDEPMRTVHMAVDKDTTLAANAIAELSGAGIEIEDFHLNRPSLDDVFLALTGHGAESDGTTADSTAADGAGASTDGATPLESRKAPTS